MSWAPAITATPQRPAPNQGICFTTQTGSREEDRSAFFQPVETNTRRCAGDVLILPFSASGPVTEPLLSHRCVLALWGGSRPPHPSQGWGCPAHTLRLSLGTPLIHSAVRLLLNGSRQCQHGPAFDQAHEIAH